MRSAPGAALGFGGCLAVVTMAVMAGAREHPFAGLMALAVVVALVSAMTRLPGAVLVACQGWAFHAGFVTGRAGALHFDPASVADLSVLMIIALLACALTARPARRPAMATSSRP